MPYLQRFGVNRISPLNMSWFGTKDEEQPAQNIIEENNVEAQTTKGRSWLDWAQDGLTAAGLVPGFGAIPDLVNSAVSAGRAGYAGITGDKEGAKSHLTNLGLNLAAAVPVAGQVAGATKLARSANQIQKGIKSIVPDLGEVSVKAGKAQKHGVKGIKGTKSGIEEQQIADKREDNRRKSIINEQKDLYAGSPDVDMMAKTSNKSDV